MKAAELPQMSDAGNREPPSRCLKCRYKAVRPRRRPGRTVQFRNMKALSVPADLPIPTCSRCRAEYIDRETAAGLDAALAKAYRDALRRRVRRAIDLVTEHVSQRRLEALLGLSQGYLSRLRAGQGNPSPELVSHLALIAQDPPTRLREIEKFWADPDGFPSELFETN